MMNHQPTTRDARSLTPQLSNENNIGGELNEQKSAVKRSRNRQVSFTDVTIREYKLTIGDHPCCQYGPPTGLDWDYEEVHFSGVEEYEAGRGPRWKNPCLSYFRRKEILIGAGFAEKELRAATRQKEYCNFQRQVSKTISYVWRIEDALESLSRKTSRAAKSIMRRVRRANIMPSVHEHEASKRSKIFCARSTTSRRSISTSEGGDASSSITEEEEFRYQSGRDTHGNIL